LITAPAANSALLDPLISFEYSLLHSTMILQRAATTNTTERLRRGRFHRC
jgi:hypothetical protein